MWPGQHRQHEGGVGAVTPEILALAERGLRRMLHAVGMLPGYEPDAKHGLTMRVLGYPEVDGGVPGRGAPPDTGEAR